MFQSKVAIASQSSIFPAPATAECEILYLTSIDASLSAQTSVSVMKYCLK